MNSGVDIVDSEERKRLSFVIVYLISVRTEVNFVLPAMQIFYKLTLAYPKRQQSMFELAAVFAILPRLCWLVRIVELPKGEFKLIVFFYAMFWQGRIKSYQACRK